MADAYIANFETKYYFNFWRPVTAIRAADADGNIATVADPAWEPLRATPPIPDYPSAHAAVGAAAARVLTLFFGTGDLPFHTTSNTEPGAVRSLRRLLPRCYRECGLSHLCRIPFSYRVQARSKPRPTDRPVGLPPFFAAD